jgi:glutamate 5-kinase
VIPVINENDSVSVEGITFQENDKLAATVAATARADLAIYLSDQKGLFTANPELNADAELIARVGPHDDVSAYAEGAIGPESKGGMVATLAAAQMLAGCGIAAVMASGRTERVITRILAGEEVGTFFVSGEAMQGRKLWIATAIEPAGTLVVDEGARRALEHPDGASLLPIGITEVRGDFGAGDLVRITGRNGVEFARGLTNYSAAEADMISGLHTSRISETLGHVGHDEVVHRDNMVLGEQGA